MKYIFRQNNHYDTFYYLIAFIMTHKPTQKQHIDTDTT